MQEEDGNYNLSSHCELESRDNGMLQAGSALRLRLQSQPIRTTSDFAYNHKMLLAAMSTNLGETSAFWHRTSQLLQNPV